MSDETDDTSDRDATREKLRAWLHDVAEQPETGDFLKVADILQGEGTVTAQDADASESETDDD